MNTKASLTCLDDSVKLAELLFVKSIGNGVIGMGVKVSLLVKEIIASD